MDGGAWGVLPVLLLGGPNPAPSLWDQGPVEVPGDSLCVGVVRPFILHRGKVSTPFTSGLSKVLKGSQRCLAPPSFPPTLPVPGVGQELVVKEGDRGQGFPSSVS